MAKYEIPWKKSIFIRLVITFLIIIVPIYAIGFNIYNWGISTVKKEISDSMKAQDSFCLNSLERDLQRTQLLQYNFFNDNALIKLANETPIISEYERVESIQRIEKQLLAIKNSSRYISKAIIHIPALGINIDTVEAKNISAKDKEMMGDVLVVKNKAVHVWKNKLLSTACAPYSNSYDSENLPDYFFEIELSNSEIRKTLEELKLNDKSGSFLFSERTGFIIMNSSDKSIVNNLISFIQAKNLSAKDEILSVSLNKNKYLAIFSKSDYLDMTLVRYIPENIVFKKVNIYRVWFWFFSLVTFCITVLFSIYANNFIHKPLSRLIKAFGKIESGELNISIRHEYDDEFRYIYERFNNMVGKINTLIDQIYKQKILVQKAELKQLQSQINPHFLYNSFFMLSRRIKYGDSEAAFLFCEQLGNYFQFITRSADDTVPLHKEVEHARIYANIQAIRFSNRIAVEFDELPQEVRNIIVPRLILQPVIENAYEHGLEDKEQDGKLMVKFLMEKTYLNVHIEDNGDRMTDSVLIHIQDKLSKEDTDMETTGILNIHKRIRLTFGEESGLNVSRSELGGLKVVIVMKI